VLSLKVVVQVVTDFRELRRKAEKAKEKVLKRSGAIVRSIMRNSIKYRAKGSSPPGSPPYSHVKSGGIKNLILFEYDAKTQTVVIGPARDPQTMANVAPVPGTLETGGRSRVRLPPRLRKARGKPTTIATVKARPFAKPALERFESTYPDLWSKAIE
jgi:hypothetical protein